VQQLKELVDLVHSGKVFINFDIWKGNVFQKM
jgi:hypothetical protein